MNKKSGLLIILFLMVVLIIGASMLYNHFKTEAEVEQIVTRPTQQIETQPTNLTLPPQTETPIEESESRGDEVEEGEQRGEKAPDFSVYDVNGNEVRLSNYIGKPIILNFWASWCGPCQMEMPGFETKFNELGDEVQFLMVNMTDGHQETVNSASQFILNKGYTFPVFYDTSYEAAIAYNVYEMPVTYFIDSDGYIVAYAIGAIDIETLMQGIEMIY